MTLEKTRRNAPMPALFGVDQRDRRPGTHFATELGAPLHRTKKKSRAVVEDPHVDEDLGVSAFGIDLPFLEH